MKIKKIFVITTSIIFIISILLLLLVVIIYFNTKNNIDFSIDESLFISNSSGNYTRLYYNLSDNHEEYSPGEYSSILPSSDRKTWFSYDTIGENIKQAFLAAEDRHFFEHKGVDIKRTLLAGVNYIFRLKPKFGASTITQQVVKNISGDNQETIKRKFSEMIRANHIESTHSKEDIFELYLNIVPMSNSIAGVGLASKYYFDKLPSELTVYEAATLAGITNAPSKYNPLKNEEECIKKRNNVLYAMYQCEFIDIQEYESAISAPLSIKIGDIGGNKINSWFVETVCDDICHDLMSKKGISEGAARVMINNGGLSIYTTVNPRIQNILENYFENLDNFPEAAKNGLDCAMVITDSNSGDIVAIVGNCGKKSGNRLSNHATISHTPGSALKPIALYAPLINTRSINWATVIDDVPVYFNRKAPMTYTAYPKNYPDIYDGLTTVSDALRLSKNTVAVRLYELIGKEQIYYNLTKNFGFDTIVRSETLKNGSKISDLNIAPLALGQLSHGVSLRKLTDAYTVFSGDGTLRTGRTYVSVYDDRGNLVLENPSESKEVFSRECARIMNQLLSRVTESGTAKSIKLKEIVDTAGKTGTSGDDKDRLFVGYTPYYTAGIWLGYGTDRNSIGKIEKSHLEIWDDVMIEIHRYCLNKSEAIRSFSTDGLLYLPYCKDSGKVYSDNCMCDPRGDRMSYGYFSPKDIPNGICDRHVLCEYDFLTEGMAFDGCDSEYVKLVSLLDISDRSFPCQIYITDAEFVYRKIDYDAKLGDSYDVPYFVFTLEEGEYVGKSRSKKQFNSACYIHSD